MLDDLITTATSTEESERGASVALLPVGSFEQHGSHLPLITDTVVACAIAAEIAKSYPVLRLPPLTVSCSHEHAAWAGTVSISAKTLYATINDIAASLERSGIRKLVIVNGHGGNYVLSNVVQEANVTEPRMSLFPTSRDWVKARDDAGLVSDFHEDMHGGEIETSILLDVWPELIRPGNETADHIANDRSHLLVLGMQEYTKTGIIGRPSLGTAEKGRAVLTSLAASFAHHAAALGGTPGSA
ncbi:MAG: creatininase family protein [Micromonosporaceae bacterium]